MIGTEGSVRRRPSCALVVLAMVLLIVADSVYAQELPKDGRGFVAWCQQRGLETNDPRGSSCSSTIQVRVTAVLGQNPNAPECKALAKRISEAENFRPIALPVYEWLRNHRKLVHGSAQNMLDIAIKEVYGCY